MPSSLRVRLDPSPGPVEPGLALESFATGFTLRGGGDTKAPLGEPIAATLSFTGRFYTRIRGNPEPVEKPLGELTGQLTLSAEQRVEFLCDEDSLETLRAEPEPEPVSDEDAKLRPFLPRTLALELGEFLREPAQADADADSGESEDASATGEDKQSRAAVPVLRLPKDSGQFRFMELVVKLSLDGAVEADFEQNDVLDVRILPEIAQLESSFALDLLERAAAMIEEKEFLAWSLTIFGSDIPLSAYESWLSDLLASRAPAPKIVVVEPDTMHGELGAYDNGAQTIRIPRDLPLQAETDPSRAATLFLVLLHEFGHHQDNLLRRHYSDVGGDAPGEEGALFAFGIAGLDQAETDHVSFAKHTHGGETHELVLEYPEFHQALKDYIADPAKQDDAKRNNVEGFSAGRGRTAGNFFAHQSIEDALSEVDSQFFLPSHRKQIYFGNWERDYSQFCTGVTLSAFSILFRLPGGLPGGPPMSVDEAHRAARNTITSLLDRKAREEFADIQPTKVTTANLGVYRPEQHIDNPRGLKDDTHIDKEFRGGVLNAETEIDLATGLKKYIATEGQLWDTSTGYVRTSLAAAKAAGLNAEGMRLFGQALHTVEDLYAHSNFIELALIRLGHTRVFPWVGGGSNVVVRGDNRFPLVTGVFGYIDTAVSLFSTLAESLTPAVECEGRVFSKKEVEVVTLLLNGFANSGGNGMVPLLEPIQVNKDDVGQSLKDFSKALCTASEVTKTWIKRKIGASLDGILGQLANLEDKYLDKIGSSKNSDPTHSMLSKDHPDHPLHPLAAVCAKAAIKQVGGAMRDAFMGNGDLATAQRVALGFFVHPNDIGTTGDARSSLLTLIDDFAKANPTVIGELDLFGSIASFHHRNAGERAELRKQAEEANKGDQNAPAIIRGLLPLLDPKMYYQLYGVDF